MSGARRRAATSRAARPRWSGGRAARSGSTWPRSPARGLEPGQRALAAEQLQRLEQRRADPAAGDRDPDRPEGDARLEPSSSTSASRSAVLDGGGRPVATAPRARRTTRATTSRPASSSLVGRARTTPRRRTGSRASATASVSLFIRSATSGIASSSSCASASSTGSLTTPASLRNGSTRWVSSSIDSIRMWSALIASAFLRSKRAGLGLTSPMSKASTISSSVKTSRSAAIAQPSRAR